MCQPKFTNMSLNIAIISLLYPPTKWAAIFAFSTSYCDYPFFNLSLNIKVKPINNSYQLCAQHLLRPAHLFPSSCYTSLSPSHTLFTVKPGSVPPIADHYLLCQPCFLANNKIFLLPLKYFVSSIIVSYISVPCLRIKLSI